MALSNTGGTIFVNYTYEPFGNTSQSGSTTNLYQFTGRESDATGLYYYRARYYSPQLQRFFSEDPIGFLSKDTNLYSYAYTDPVDFTDANGDCPLCIVGIVGGIGGVIGAAEEGYKAYQCGAQGWNLAGAVGRGFVAGGTGAIVGLVAGFASKNPFLGGALGAATYNLVNQSLGANVSTTSAIVGTVTGGLTGMAGGEIADSVLPVRGGENFNPFTSVRTLGPKAAQLYGETGASGVLGVAGDIGTDAALAKLSGRKDSCE
jgi:RHS repeat-associated protein